jgi:hypothetical protein
MQPGDTFAFADDGEGYKVGCGPQEWRPGASGLFEDIPTPCTVSLHGTSGAIGAAYTNRPVAWASISREDGSTIRRTFLDLDYAGVEFIENQFLGVRTVEPRFHDLDRGRVLHARELIDVM